MEPDLNDALLWALRVAFPLTLLLRWRPRAYRLAETEGVVIRWKLTWNAGSEIVTTDAAKIIRRGSNILGRRIIGKPLPGVIAWLQSATHAQVTARKLK